MTLAAGQPYGGADGTRMSALRGILDAWSVLRAAAPRTALLGFVTRLLIVGCGFGQIGLLALALNRIQTTSLNEASTELLTLGAAALALVAISDLAGTVQHAVDRITTERVELWLMNRLLRVSATCGYPLLEHPQFHDRLQRIVHNQVAVTRVAETCLNFAVGVIGGVGSVLVLSAISWWLGPLAVVGFLPLGVAAVRASRAYYALSTTVAPDERELAYLRFVMSARPFAKDIRIQRAQEYLLARHASIGDRRLRSIVSVYRSVLRRMAAASAVSFALPVSLVTLLALSEPASTRLTAVITAVVALSQLDARLRGVITSLGESVDLRLVFEDSKAILATPTSTRPTPPDRRGWSLRLQDASYQYPGATTPAVSAINIDLVPGEVVALVGENGAGKTTIAMMLAGLYEPRSGTVRLHDGTREDRNLEGQVAMSFQDFACFNATLRENITFCDETDPAHLQQVVEAADLGSVVRRLPDGLETVLGMEFEGGMDLSRGEWQRVAIARTLYRGTPVVILDEPTAFADPVSEERFIARMRDAFAGRCLLVVSHRLSTVRDADRIHLVVGGRILDSGTHADLMSSSLGYRRLFDFQARA